MGDGTFGGAEGFAGTTESLRLGGAAEGGPPREEAMGGLEVVDEELVDFFRAGATVEAFAMAGFVAADVFGGNVLTLPAPNVPELMICS